MTVTFCVLSFLVGLIPPCLAMRRQEQRWTQAVELLRQRIRGKVRHKEHSRLVQREDFETYLHKQGVL